MANEALKRTIQLNLQLFAQEKTEKATPRKRQKAKKEGQILKSMEFTSAVVLLVSFFTLKLFFPYMLEQINGFFNEMYKLWGNKEFELNVNTADRLSLAAMEVSVRTVLPLAGITLVTGVAASLFQTGFVFTTKNLKPNLNAINPISGMKRLVSVRSLVELVKSMVKVAIVGYLAYSTYRSELYRFPEMLDMSIQVSTVFIGQLILKMAFKIGVCLLLFSAFDYYYQWWEHERKLKMTKQEVKEEHKMTEGDPKVKSAIRRRQQQMSMARMMQMVPQADVVITNPTHFAVALKYDPETMDAPEVVAKGQDLVAQKIKEVAKENKVTLVENKPLAQALYKAVEVGQTVPGDLFQAVAEVLAYVYKLKGKI